MSSIEQSVADTMAGGRMSQAASGDTSELANGRDERVLYLTYSDPAGYPPLHHSARMLANAGWYVFMVGVRIPTVAALRLPAHERITSKYFPPSREGWRQKLHYLAFCAWVLAYMVRTRARWVYASDAISAPPALIASYVPGVRVIYHEHDSPTSRDAREASAFARVIAWARRRLARRASLCVLPQQERASWFRSTVGVQHVACVWNCPSREEAAEPLREHDDATLHIVYQGSIVPDRLPMALAQALQGLPDGVFLEVIGYTTLESRGYMAEFLEFCEILGVRERVRFHGPMERRQLLELCRRFDVGLALIREGTRDMNMQWMVGASNKPFDYLSCGLPLLVTDNPAWRAFYADKGYGIACDPQSSESLASAIRWYLEHPRERCAMGAAGRQRIQSDWNYESQFAPVLQHMLGPRRIKTKEGLGVAQKG